MAVQLDIHFWEWVGIDLPVETTSFVWEKADRVVGTFSCPRKHSGSPVKGSTGKIELGYSERKWIRRSAGQKNWNVPITPMYEKIQCTPSAHNHVHSFSKLHPTFQF